MIGQITTMVTVAGGLVAITVAACGGVRWIFMRGADSGRAEVEHDAEQRAQAQAEISLRATVERVAELEHELKYLRKRHLGAWPCYPHWPPDPA